MRLTALVAILAIMFAMKSEAGPSCATIKSLAAGYTAAQLSAMADNYGLTEKQKSRACACVFGKRAKECRKK